MNSSKDVKQVTKKQQAGFQKGSSVSPISRAIADLEETERIVVTLFYYQELSLIEIGRLLGLTEGQIREYRFLGLKHLGRAIRCVGSANHKAAVTVGQDRFGQTNIRGMSPLTVTPVQ